MAKIIPIRECFQHFLAEMKESFWGDLYGRTQLAWQRFFELEWGRQRDRFSGWGRYERAGRKPPGCIAMVTNELCNSIRHHPAADRAHPREEFLLVHLSRVVCTIHHHRTLHCTASNTSSVPRYASIMTFGITPKRIAEKRSFAWLTQKRSPVQDRKRRWLRRGSLFITFSVDCGEGTS